MSSEADNEEFTLEKIRCTYTDITVDDCPSSSKSSTGSVITTTTLLPLNKAASHPLSIVSTSGDRNIETTHSQLKQVAERKIPPYTNFHKSCPNIRVSKSNNKINIPETSTNSACKKQGSPVIPDSVFVNNRTAAVKPNVSLNLISKNEKTSQTQKNQSEREPSNHKVLNDYSNSDLPTDKDNPDQITHLPSNISNDIFEKNIQTKVLTFTRANPTKSPTISNYMTSSPTISNAPKDTKLTKALSPVPNIKNPSNNAELFKPLKSVSIKPADETNNKNVSPKIICATSIHGVSKGNMIVNTCELQKNIKKKQTTAESTWNLPPKQIIVNTSSSENVKSPTDSTLNTLPKQTMTLTGTRVLKPTTAVSVTPICTPRTITQETVQVQTMSANITSNPSVTLVQLSSLSEFDYSNKQLLDAINSGSNVNVTQSVTLSKPALSAVQGSVTVQPMANIVVPIVVQQSVPNQKGKSNTSNEALQKVNSPSNPRKSTETKSQTQTQSSDSDTSRETIGSSSPSADMADKFEVSSSVCSNETEANEDFSSSKKKQEEPVCLTISSDEEAEESEELMELSNTSEISALNKEPPLENEKQSVANDSLYDVCYVLADGSIETDEESALDTASGDGYIKLECRTIRIGSYRFSPHVPVVLSKFGLRIVIPSYNMSSENVVLKIPNQEITRVLIHFGKSIPVIFYYVTKKMGEKVRNILNMTDPQDVYFDPGSLNESQKRITLLPETFSDVDRINIRELFEDGALMKELNHKEANTLLVRSVPETQKVIKQVPNPVQTIMVFPPPPEKGGISINTEDYSCLAQDVFLNDVIIDFYLKYLYLNRLSEEDREKTHIFSSFFYKRLTDKATPMSRNVKSGGNSITAADIRHSRVKNWTKNIDLFSKDYIVIPLNENQHWFLAIICFPGLTGPVKYTDNSPIEVKSKEQKTEKTFEKKSGTDSEEQNIATIGSTTISRRKMESKEATLFSIDEENDVEDRDEAEATDEDVNISDEDTEEEFFAAEVEEKLKRQSKPEREPIKQPCILIFDSLAGASRARIIATLRDYLRVEYKIKHGEDRDFSKNVVKGAVPAVPQQDNFTDCGLYVLQYVEAFFDDKITDYHLPIKTLRDWFPSEIVSRKRHAIQQLLLELMQEQNIDIETLNLPKLHLSHLSQSDEEYDDDSEFYYGEEEEEFDHESDYGIDIHDVHRQQHIYRGPYHGDSEEGEYYDEEDEDEEELISRSRFELYDSDDEIHDEDIDSDEDNSDDDIVYKDLEDMEVTRTRKNRRALNRKMEKSGECEDEGEEDVEEEELSTDDVDNDEQQLSSDIEEKLNNSSLNRDTVSIKLTSVSRAHPVICNNSVTTVSTISPTSSLNSQSRENSSLVRLKPARPWGSADQSNDSCSTIKKFKQN